MIYNRKLARVHWCLIHLSKNILSNYIFKYDYSCHNYTLYRNKGYKLYDCYMIVRTSRKCFRLMYYNSHNLTTKYYTFRKSKDVAAFINNNFIEE